MGSITNPKIPVLDFTNQDLKPNTPLWLSTSKEACKALEEYGCFVAVYDKVLPQLEKAMFLATEELFNLPIETKMKNVINKPYHGYVGQRPELPLHEAMGIDNVMNKEVILEFTNHMWPEGNDRFRENTYSFSHTVAELEGLVVRMIFEEYGVEKYYDSHFESKIYLLKFLKYWAPPEGGSAPAFPPHSDKSFLTIIHQKDVNGLEVKTKDGKWIGLDLHPKSYVVMTGEISMGWSNDRIHPCEHRVTMSGNKTRYALGLFAFLSGTTSVPDELVDDEHPLKYKPFNNLDLINFYSTEEGYKAECPLKAYCGI